MRSSRGRYRFSRSSRASRSENPSTRYYRFRNSGSSGEKRGSNNLERGENGRRPRRYTSRYRNGPSRFNDGRLTPYQGPRRTYGYFRCGECGRTWSSGNSWANCGQQCLSCKINVYPYRQTRLLGEKTLQGEGPDKAHKSDLCEKCKELGYSCLRYIEELRRKAHNSKICKKCQELGYNCLKRSEELDNYFDDD